MEKPAHTIDLLLRACRKGDPRAQQEVYARYFRAMYNTALRMVNDPWDAEDLMQEAFLDAFSHMDSWEERASFGSWLKRIVVNRCLNHLKKRKVSFSHSAQEEWEKWPEEKTGVEWMPEISPEVVANAITQLADGYRVILSLHLIEGYDHEEIAGILGIQPSTSRSQFTRGREKLRQILLRQLQTDAYHGKNKY
ncbi:MAG: sigma-70 family RNA polymerase sigma factor [Bacteroidia bacterium]